MYLPEEPAFRVLCQLLDGAGVGVGLRSMYLPGLSGLKEELRMLDWLMERLMPELKQHLEVSILLWVVTGLSMVLWVAVLRVELRVASGVQLRLRVWPASSCFWKHIVTRSRSA